MPLVIGSIFEENPITIIVYFPIGLNFKTFLSIYEFSTFTEDFLVSLICEILEMPYGLLLLFQDSGLNSMCTWKLWLLPCDKF